MRRCCGAVPVALTALLATATAALAHGGGSTDYESELRTVTPAGAAVEVRVLDRDDRLVLRNRSGRTVVVKGYRGEPYARLSPDGTVEVNLNSPAHYLNEDRFANVELPARADEHAKPAWRVVGRSGEFEWHDHRIHWMGAGRPPAVADEQRRTKVFDWKVPFRVGGRPGELAGTLTWVGRPDDGFPVAAAVALAALILGGAGLTLFVRRRRRSRGARVESAPPEAW